MFFDNLNILSPFNDLETNFGETCQDQYLEKILSFHEENSLFLLSDFSEDKFDNVKETSGKSSKRKREKETKVQIKKDDIELTKLDIMKNKIINIYDDIMIKFESINDTMDLLSCMKNWDSKHFYLNGNFNLIQRKAFKNEKRVLSPFISLIPFDIEKNDIIELTLTTFMILKNERYNLDYFLNEKNSIFSTSYKKSDQDKFYGKKLNILCPINLIQGFYSILICIQFSKYENQNIQSHFECVASNPFQIVARSDKCNSLRTKLEEKL